MASRILKTENKTENFTCTNLKCRRAFASPIFIQNLSLRNSYYGCPYCLIKVEVAFKSEETCVKGFGYLSHHAKGVDIPEECLVCQKLVDCFLSKLRG